MREIDRGMLLSAGLSAGIPVGFSVAMIFFIAVPEKGHTADTVEPFEKGAIDFELYTGVAGTGLELYEYSMFGEVVFGYGIWDQLSGYIGIVVDSNSDIADEGAVVALGILGTIVDTRFFDGDLIWETSFERKAYTMSSLVELNVDLHPQQKTVGSYLRSGIALCRQYPQYDFTTVGEYRDEFQLVGLWGVYATLGDGYQIFFEYDLVLHTVASPLESSIEVGGVAVGVNVAVHDRIKFINQVYLDIPQSPESLAAEISTGMVATFQ
ncbi:MAG: hypothetical protein JXX29_04230 [Deltaproteobacteria bacterium]|nr:hypothetical protein [Deltaproteobacteria bacterium]MBN2670852.1 hypothetical protein [Deltaproteobacteria bacterium]